METRPLLVVRVHILNFENSREKQRLLWEEEEKRENRNNFFSFNFRKEVRLCWKTNFRPN